MKTKPVVILIAVTMVFCSFQNTFAQQPIEKQNSTLTLDSPKIIYTCPMHSEITSDKPGICLKCGMELVKLENAKKQMGMMMCPMDGMVDMNHKHGESKKNKKDKMKMMKGMGMGMGLVMAVMMVLMVTGGGSHRW